MSIFLYGYLYGLSNHNVKITCVYRAESPEIVEGRQRNRGQVDRATLGMAKTASLSGGVRLLARSLVAMNSWPDDSKAKG
jgi:hypothetical protein